jgi:hypothetical protein
VTALRITAATSSASSTPGAPSRCARAAIFATFALYTAYGLSTSSAGWCSSLLAMKRVRTAPGWISATRMPNGATSGRSASHSASIAYLVIAYGHPVGGVTSPAADPRLTISPLR